MQRLRPPDVLVGEVEVDAVAALVGEHHGPPVLAVAQAQGGKYTPVKTGPI